MKNKQEIELDNIIDETINLIKNVLDKNSISIQHKEQIQSLDKRVKYIRVEINKNIN